MNVVGVLSEEGVSERVQDDPISAATAPPFSGEVQEEKVTPEMVVLAAPVKMRWREGRRECRSGCALSG